MREPAAPDESGAIMARLESEWRARGWAPRAEVAEEIAQAIETHGVGTVTGMQRQAAAIARAHRTTPEAADG